LVGQNLAFLFAPFSLKSKVFHYRFDELLKLLLRT